jgi:hypothetical protein
MSCVIFLYRRVGLEALPCFSVPSTRSPVLIHQHIETWKGPSPVQGTEISFCKGQKFGKVLMTKELEGINCFQVFDLSAAVEDP